MASLLQIEWSEEIRTNLQFKSSLCPSLTLLDASLQGSLGQDSSSWQASWWIAEEAQLLDTSLEMDPRCPTEFEVIHSDPQWLTTISPRWNLTLAHSDINVIPSWILQSLVCKGQGTVSKMQYVRGNCLESSWFSRPFPPPSLFPGMPQDFGLSQEQATSPVQFLDSWKTEDPVDTLSIDAECLMCLTAHFVLAFSVSLFSDFGWHACLRSSKCFVVVAARHDCYKAKDKDKSKKDKSKKSKWVKMHDVQFCAIGELKLS